MLEVPRNLTEAQKKLIQEFEDGSTSEMYTKKKSFADIVRDIFSGEDKKSERKKKKKK